VVELVLPPSAVGWERRAVGCDEIKVILKKLKKSHKKLLTSFL
jgi:hypothetical protein